jgi:hypothetical protein
MLSMITDDRPSIPKQWNRRRASLGICDRRPFSLGRNCYKTVAPASIALRGFNERRRKRVAASAAPCRPSSEGQHQETFHERLSRSVLSPGAMLMARSTRTDSSCRTSCNRDRRSCTRSHSHRSPARNAGLTTARRDFRANSSCGSRPYGAKARRVSEDSQVKIRRMSPPRIAEICPDRQSEKFHSPESAQHPAFYRYRESYPRRNGSPRNCCSRAGDERNAVPVSV